MKSTRRGLAGVARRLARVRGSSGKNDDATTVACAASVRAAAATVADVLVDELGCHVSVKRPGTLSALRANATNGGGRSAEAMMRDGAKATPLKLRCMKLASNGEGVVRARVELRASPGGGCVVTVRAVRVADDVLAAGSDAHEQFVREICATFERLVGAKR